MTTKLRPRATELFIISAAWGFIFFGTMKAMLITTYASPFGPVDPVFTSLSSRTISLIAGGSEIACGIFLFLNAPPRFIKLITVWSVACGFVAYRILADGRECPCAGILNKIVPQNYRYLLEFATIAWIFILLLGSILGIVAESRKASSLGQVASKNTPTA